MSQVFDISLSHVQLHLLPDWPTEWSNKSFVLRFDVAGQTRLWTYDLQRATRDLTRDTLLTWPNVTPMQCKFRLPPDLLLQEALSTRHLVLSLEKQNIVNANECVAQDAIDLEMIASGPTEWKLLLLDSAQQSRPIARVCFKLTMAHSVNKVRIQLKDLDLSSLNLAAFAQQVVSINVVSAENPNDHGNEDSTFIQGVHRSLLPVHEFECVIEYVDKTIDGVETGVVCELSRQRFPIHTTQLPTSQIVLQQRRAFESFRYSCLRIVISLVISGAIMVLESKFPFVAVLLPLLLQYESKTSDSTAHFIQPFIFSKNVDLNSLKVTKRMTTATATTTTATRHIDSSNFDNSNVKMNVNVNEMIDDSFTCHGMLRVENGPRYAQMRDSIYISEEGILNGSRCDGFPAFPQRKQTSLFETNKSSNNNNTFANATQTLSNNVTSTAVSVIQLAHETCHWAHDHMHKQFHFPLERLQKWISNYSTLKNSSHHWRTATSKHKICGSISIESQQNVQYIPHYWKVWSASLANNRSKSTSLWSEFKQLENKTVLPTLPWTCQTFTQLQPCDKHLANLNERMLVELRQLYAHDRNKFLTNKH